MSAQARRIVIWLAAATVVVAGCSRDGRDMQPPSSDHAIVSTSQQAH